MEAVVDYGALCLIPVACVIVCAIVTKRATESLFIGTFVASIMIAKGDFFWTWLDFLSSEMLDSTYYILMFGLFGAIIKVLEKSGSAQGFSDLATKLAKTGKQSLLFTWFISLFIFIDDYLNSLTLGVAMRKITDRYKISREFLAFIINSTGATICILVPMSSWGAVMSAQLDGLVEGISGFQVYVSAIPFMFYAWAAVILTPLFGMGVIPLFGPMKKAEQRARETGQTLPDNAPGGADVIDAGDIKPSNPVNFLLPMLVLAGITIWSGDILLGLIGGYALLLVMCLSQRFVRGSDAVTITSAATGIRNIDYAKTAIPLIVLPFVIGAALYLIAGFIF